ncbi:MAG: hypothetical protein ACFFD4_09525 [Candidatus Odinarchaeota archaeon]
MAVNIEEVISSFMQTKKIGFFDPQYGRPVKSTLKTESEVILAINTSNFQNMNSIGNCVYFRYHRPEEKAESHIFIKIRILEQYPEDAFVDISDLPDQFILRTIKLPVCFIYFAAGMISIQCQYTKYEMPSKFSLYRYYNLIREQPGSAIAFNSQEPLKELQFKVGYFGDSKSEEEIISLMSDLAQCFYRSTKRYVVIDCIYVGSQPLPGDGEIVAGKLHDYVAWWLGLDHDLEGTNLLPLHVDDPDDLKIIRIAWYKENQLQLGNDAKEIFPGVLSENYIIFNDALYGSGGASFAHVATYDMTDFWQEVGTVKKYGLPPIFGPRTTVDILFTALHELGHLFGCGHLEHFYEPAEENWQVFYDKSFLQSFANYMATATIHDLLGFNQVVLARTFYSDSDLLRIRTNYNIANDFPFLPFPLVFPIGSPTKQPNLTLRGKKQNGAGIVINDEVVLDPGNETEWVITVPLEMGVNIFDISEIHAGLTGHSVTAFTERIAEDLPSVPHTSLTLITSSSIWLYQVIVFDISSQAEAGLKGAWWWCEKQNDEGQFELIKGIGHWQDAYGAVKMERRYRITFDEPGVYRVKARSRDMLYPVPGSQHQSDIAEFEIEIMDLPG